MAKSLPPQPYPNRISVCRGRDRHKTVTVDLPWPLRVRTCLLDRALGNDRLRRNSADQTIKRRRRLALGGHCGSSRSRNPCSSPTALFSKKSVIKNKSEASEVVPPPSNDATATRPSTGL